MSGHASLALSGVSGRPFGLAAWMEQTAARWGLELIPRPRGRPSQRQKDELTPFFAIFSEGFGHPALKVGVGPRFRDEVVTTRART